MLASLPFVRGNCWNHDVVVAVSAPKAFWLLPKPHGEMMFFEGLASTHDNQEHPDLPGILKEGRGGDRAFAWTPL